MSNQPVDTNAKLALNAMKMEISSEIIGESNILQDNIPMDSIGLSARVGGQMSKRLVEIGKEQLISQYKKESL
ncbi:MAG: small, acid-soluble spore protein, alpha/beta type [Terrisporobacter sp.]